MAILPGRRVYPPEPEEDLPHPLPPDLQRGDYWLDPTTGYWMCYGPKGSVGDLRNHEVTENEDGTITVSPSILIEHWDKAKCWHGYLEHGTWREI